MGNCLKIGTNRVHCIDSEHLETNELTTVSISQSSHGDLNSSSDEEDFDPMILVSMLYCNVL